MSHCNKCGRYTIVFQNGCSIPKCKCCDNCSDCGNGEGTDPVEPKWPEGAEEGDFLVWRGTKPIWEPLTTQLDPILEQLLEQVEDMIEAAVGTNYLNKFLDTVKTIAYNNIQDDWLLVNGLVEGAGNNGGTVSVPNRTIILPGGSSAAGSYLKESFYIGSFSQYIVGDVIKFQLELTETVPAGIGPNTLEVNFYINDVEYENINPIMTPVIGSFITFNITFEYALQNLTDEFTIEIKVPSNATVQISTLTIGWTGLSIVSTKEIYNTITKAIAQTLKKADQLYLHLFRSPRLSQANPAGIGDQSSIIQDEIRFAEDTSGEWIMPPNAKFRVANTVEITKSVTIKGAGKFNCEFNPGFDGSIFTVKTNEPVIFQDFGLRRIEVSFLNPDLVKFLGSDINTTYLNKNSFIQRISFNNIPTALNIDYTDYLTIKNCIFNSGQYGIKGGYINNSSNSNLNIVENEFSNINLNGIDLVGANMLNIIDNDFIKNLLSSAEVRRNIQININTGTHNNIKITNNKSNYFTQYGIIIAISGTASVKNVYILDNGFSDESTSINSLPVAITSDNANKITGVFIHRNPLDSKVYALYLKNIDTVNVQGNMFTGITGFPLAKASYREVVTNLVQIGNNYFNITEPDDIF